MSDAPYLGETIEWKFANEDEWRSYVRTRPFPVVSPGPLIAILSLIGLWFAFQDQAWILWSLALALIAHLLHIGVVFLWQKHNNRKYGLRSVSVRFHPGWIKVTEHYGDPNKFRSVVSQFHRQSRIDSVHWVAGGCKFELKRQFLVRKSFVLPIAMFKSESDLAALYAWAAHHGITIEGPAPIPGAYLRPME